ncbi:dihydrolipoyl dehydrogenase [Alkalihalobacillus sp. TS-13]|uniref:dihydrolipoyl dehydrogenase n=1 Tax=Alkalihalobacillus sp. TS-13 TaxID=2842455 RepID=UPI001C867489|nr:dihydrolipoyl dehydrogenase [Alkalihalobacillus sp. TS-13]
MTKTYDIAVVGGGPGGYVAALHAAKLGKKVALVEVTFLGGTCLNKGCIPSKTLLKHAEVIESIHKAEEWGIETGNLTFSLEKMIKRKDDVIQRLRNGISFLLKQGKIDVYEGFGRIEQDNRIQIDAEQNNQTINAENIIIATGSIPAVPPIEGLDTVTFDTSDTIFDIPDIPKSLTIIGGGVIGVEFACIFASLNVEVTLIEMEDRLLPGEDRDASKLLANELRKKGVKLLLNTKVDCVHQAGAYKTVNCTDDGDNEHVIETETLLVSVGRKPNLSAVANLNLLKDGPFIKVNEQLETNLPNIYAVGDVIGGYQLAHVASAEGIVAANNAAGGSDQIDYKVIPRCIYTLPEIASVGITEEEARTKGIVYKTERFDLSGNGKAIAEGHTSGFSKIIYEEKFGEIIGVIMAGPHVTEMISEASAFMYLEGTIEEAAKMIHPHPSVSESFFENASSIYNKMKQQDVLV